jgi:hypothetical protein
MTKVIAAAVAILGALLVGWANLHTDEPTVVVAFAVPIAFVAGALWPRASVATGFGVGAAVPIGTLLAYWLGWRTPYPIALATVYQSCMIFAFTISAALFGAVLSRAIFASPASA